VIGQRPLRVERVTEATAGSKAQGAVSSEG
jgi:hypothetical protein